MLAFACKTESLGSLYSHPLLIPTKSSKYKSQLMQFKDLISSTCQLSSERRVLDMESEVNQRPGFNPHWGNIFILEFPCSKASDANTGVIANIVCL